ncbi:MAG: hypothetical protein PHD61_02780 [Bacteroidales bacterium]|nr:hypothetical protein [Bacteroidales bacterium]
MLLHHPLEKIGFETIHSLVIIVLILGTSVALSVLISKDNGKKSPETGASTSEQS